RRLLHVLADDVVRGHVPLPRVVDLAGSVAVPPGRPFTVAASHTDGGPKRFSCRAGFVDTVPVNHFAARAV
ncbi:hypothetical protein, partial [Verrucosispora sp. ts21]|uniref:hypothetical protein n=1 Tax=Verrucosispora sp. ts21 TaxID=2069341 RepID=UPI001E2E0A92